MNKKIYNSKQKKIINMNAKNNKNVQKYITQVMDKIKNDLNKIEENIEFFEKQ